MCPPSVSAQTTPADVEGQLFFRPDVKCCTYHPTLPNYLVGGLLQDPRPEMAAGQERVRAKIAARTGVSPGWLAAPVKYRLLLRAARGSSFGRSTTLRCPYYETDGGSCTIWAYREADCSTFFCKYDGGADGQAFWRRFRLWLAAVERTLVQYAIREVGTPEMRNPPPYREYMTLEELEDRPPKDARYRDDWDAYAGREEEFYIAAWECVSALDANRAAALLAPSAAERANAEAAHDNLAAPSLPDQLSLNPQTRVVELPDGSVFIESYNPYDPTIIPRALLSALGELRPDRSLAEARAQALAVHGVSLEDDLLIALHQLRILVVP